MSINVDARRHNASALNCAPLARLMARNKKGETQSRRDVCRSNKSRIFAGKKKEKGKNVDIDEHKARSR